MGVGEMSDEAFWPPKVVQLPEWDNGGGVAVLCGGAQHRVVRRVDAVVALEHPRIDSEVAVFPRRARQRCYRAIGNAVRPHRLPCRRHPVVA
jgi:hypothetical protein